MPPSCVLKRGACYVARPRSLSWRGAHGPGRAGDTGCFPANIYCGVGTLTTVANAQRAWEAALGRLEVQVPRPAYNTWLRGTVGQSLDADRLVVAAPSAFVAEHLKRPHARHRVLRRPPPSSARNGDVAFVVRQRPGAPTSRANARGDAHRRASQPVRRSTPRYTFEAFRRGAQATASPSPPPRPVADAPGDAYNPLVVYGAVGLGKTHLLHAIGHRLHARGRAFRYVTSERLVSDYTAAVREGRRRIDEFNLAYRSLDALLIDDIQFLAGKQGTQETFFHIFNALHDNAGQIVVTSDRPPSALRLLDDRLRSRLEWGLVADVSMPDPETRAAILQRIADRSPVPVPPEIITALAQRNATCIRQLEGSLGRVVAAASGPASP